MRYTRGVTAPTAARAQDAPDPIADVLRDVARGGLAGLLAGTLVGGLGGRVVMRLAAILNPGATGLRTENGELVGAITANGTLALVIFGGLLGGAVAGIVWVVISPWIPATGWRRSALAAVAAVALGGSFVVRAGNPDFQILKADAAIIAMLLVLVAAVGAALVWLDDRLERRLPRPGPAPDRLVITYGLVALAGLLFMPLALDGYFSRVACHCANPPEWTGRALVATGVATAAWWAARIRTPGSASPKAVLVAGRVLLAAAVALGFLHLVPQVSRILAAG